MLTDLFNWIFGKKASTTIAGIIGGAASGAAAMAAGGQLNKESLISGAVVGAAGAIAGTMGRGHGEN